MSIINRVRSMVSEALSELYKQDSLAGDITINQTKPEFEGDYTIVLFSFVKLLKKSPEQLGNELGDYLVKKHGDLFERFNVIKGFLNLSIKDGYWIGFLDEKHADGSFGTTSGSDDRVIVEYSSPNTNKPLHLGHLRNNFLGWSVAEILKATGKKVFKTCIVNDRGIHICKSMLAWQKFGNGESPASRGMKGDHFVGEYYVKFNDEYKKQVDELVSTGMKKEEAEKQAPVMRETQQMLLEWEAGKAEVTDLWKKMNHWVYEGFDETYKRIGTDFDKIYYESETYLLGKKFVEEGLKKGVLNRKEDGSVWIDLSDEGLDEKLLLRKDGTSVYITQDLGLADEKYGDFKYDDSIYVIGDEQNYHMKVLKLILMKLGKPYADGIHHLSYGMVELPTGRMKSREGTVVDADDLVDEMVAIAARHTQELGKVKDFSESALTKLYDTIGLGALKFYLLRVDPKKKMIFNPEESIDFHGFTGPFVQYTHARIKSILRKASEGAADGRRQAADGTRQAGDGTRQTADIKGESSNVSREKEMSPTGTGLLKLEKDLIIQLEQYPAILELAAFEYNPSVIAIFVFNLAKAFNTFYTEHSVLNAETEEKKRFRLRLSEMTANVIASGMKILGIRVPEQM